MEQPVHCHIQRPSRYSPLTDDDIKQFELYKKSIEKKIRETFPSIPANFELKPVRICRIIGCGVFYNYKVALPDNKFAKVSFNTGGHYMEMPGNEQERKPREPDFTVDSELTSTADE